ncbi:cupin domain-containing protein [Methylomonas methanica]|uniref:Cupin 2 conserved barrel domain protein n=1 Tax=Methylomonas methanica (strain DSM 25384 / MC09) TaxID=857087 RepID=G0A660_METMM|nr:cupin domain-containing protein [Methylomonas methanica]AEG00510.1 Cupin 2 conserved barrel domain protein [Methylomonas methanica MC09]
MIKRSTPIAMTAEHVLPRVKKSLYPQPIAERHEAQLNGREKRPLAEAFGLQNFGVNLTQLAPGAISALRHAHSRQDEFIYILRGCPTLYTNAGPTPLTPGMCAGFKAGIDDAHRLVNETTEIVEYLEVGDQVVYPDDDLQASFVAGCWRFFRKDGRPY